MKDNKLEHIMWGVLIGAALMVTAMCIIVTVVPVKRTSKATQYDFDCLTEDVKKNPLEECKE